jgi:hypothetical protein
MDKPLVPERCIGCDEYTDKGLWTFVDMTRCERCFRLQLKSAKQKANGMSADTYMYDCPVCG